MSKSSRMIISFCLSHSQPFHLCMISCCSCVSLVRRLHLCQRVISRLLKHCWYYIQLPQIVQIWFLEFLFPINFSDRNCVIFHLSCTGKQRFHFTGQWGVYQVSCVFLYILLMWIVSYMQRVHKRASRGACSFIPRKRNLISKLKVKNIIQIFSQASY